MGNNPEECPVCLTIYDKVQRPRTMPCGHSLCSLCIDHLRDGGHVTCPTCRLRHPMPEGEQFPVSYSLESFIERLNLTEEAESAAAASLTARHASGEYMSSVNEQWETAGLSRSMRFLLLDQETKVLAAIKSCQEVHGQLSEYRATMSGWCEEQQRVENGLQSVINKSRRARMLVLEEESRIRAKEEEAQQRERQLHAALQGLRRVTSAQQGLPVIDDAERRTDEAEQRMRACRGMFPNAATVAAACTVMEAPHAALEIAQRVEAAQAAAATDVREPRLPPNPAWTITDKLKDMLTPPTPTVAELRSLTQPVRRLLQAGRVFAVHQVDGRRRVARMTLDGGRLFLHALQELPLPPGAAALQVSQVVPALPCLVFLDVCWPGSVQRRVVIRLSPDTPMGRHFLLLCTGQLGPSYVSSSLGGVGDKGRPGERIWFGEYMKSGLKSGAPLVPDLSKGVYSTSGRAGAMYGSWTWNPPERSGHLGVLTRDGGMWRDVFGEVMEGLSALAAAVQHTDITKVSIVDCGVVLRE